MGTRGDLRVVEAPTLLRDYTLRKLRNAIIDGHYRPGTRLVERELCEALGVSRTSVREVLRQLETERLVHVGRRRNIMVAVIAPEEARDIYWMRELLESAAIRRFIERASDQRVRELARVVKKEVRWAVSHRDTAAIMAASHKFFEIILEGSGSDVLKLVAQQLLARVSYLRRRAISAPGRTMEAGERELQAILGAIEGRDPAGAAKAHSAHIHNSVGAAIAYLTNEQRESQVAASKLRR